MSTILIDEALDFETKRFSSALEAAYFLMGIYIKQESQSLDYAIKEGQAAYEKGEYITLPDNFSKEQLSSALWN